MKNIYFLLFCFLMLSACQSEEDIEIINNDNGLNANSALTINLKRLTQNPTAFDNFIDNSSKIKVDFPFTVTVNSTDNVSLNADADYQNLIAILEATLEQDVIDLNFPLTVSQVNYINQTINSQAELNDFLIGLPASDEVNCIAFSYPVSIQFFDASNSFVDTQNISNRAQFYNFLNDLSQNGFFYQLQYPIEANVEGADISINSNSEFNTIFNTLSPTCFEPLLYENVGEGGGNPINLNDFITFVTDGDFIISNFTEDGEEIFDFENISFRFNSDNTITADDQDVDLEFEEIGQWTTFIEDGKIVFDLEFNDSFYGDLDDDWQVDNFDSVSLFLSDPSTDGDSDELLFNKI